MPTVPFSLLIQEAGGLRAWRTVHTRDRDLGYMGSPVVSDPIDLLLWDYAKLSAVKIGNILGSTIAFVLSIEAIQLLLSLSDFGDRLDTPTVSRSRTPLLDKAPF
jgi:hypothetical protein